ncbi:arginase family protein, partial [Vibrio parahaemolyticus V-223/04]
KISLTV